MNELRETVNAQRASSTHSLPSKTLANDFCILMDSEVLNGVFVAPPSRGLGEGTTPACIATR